MVKFEGILIGTGICWGLNRIFALPLTSYLVNRRFKSITFIHSNGGVDEASDESQVRDLATQYYIIVDILVMGVAGFLFGSFLGWYFIGIALKARDWPGLIAFILMSLLGCSLKS